MCFTHDVGDQSGATETLKERTQIRQILLIVLPRSSVLYRIPRYVDADCCQLLTACLAQPCSVHSLKVRPQLFSRAQCCGASSSGNGRFT